jgi:hypothetical protein
MAQMHRILRKFHLTTYRESAGCCQPSFIPVLTVDTNGVVDGAHCRTLQSSNAASLLTAPACASGDAAFQQP